MRGLQPQRWTSAVLRSPRPRPLRLRYLAKPSPLSRLQSTAAALQEDFPRPRESKLEPSPSPHAEARTSKEHDYDALIKLPSPPPYLASSSAKLAALHSRLRLPRKIPLETLARCLVHETADGHPSFNNQTLSVLGSDLLGYYASEFILCKYPRLPMAVVYAAMRAYVGPPTCQIMVQEWGIEPAAFPGGEVDPGLLQFLRTMPGNADPDHTGRLFKNRPIGEAASIEERAKVKPWRTGLAGLSVQNNYFGGVDEERTGRSRHTAQELLERPELRDKEITEQQAKGATLDDASMTFVRALMGAIYLHAGKDAAKRFFDDHFSSRHLDVGKMFQFNRPTVDLSRLCAREGFEAPVARIISETGRLSNTPVFVVGVFSGRDKLGEGQGSSLDEARIRAAVAALKGWYLYSPLQLRRPSDIEGRPDVPWEPVLIDGGEVIA